MRGSSRWAACIGLWLGLGLLATACGDPAVGRAMELRANRDLWASHGIDDYRASLNSHGMESETAVVLVRAGKAVDAVNKAGWPVTPDRLRVATIEDAFDVIEREIARGARRLTVVYDPEFGFPARVSVDPFNNVIDDEHGIVIEDFTVPGNPPDRSDVYLEIERRDLLEPDVFGQVRDHRALDGYRLAETATPNVYEVGPMTIELADGMVVAVPAGTTVYGPPCLRFVPVAQREDGPDWPSPCWVQVSVTPDPGDHIPATFCAVAPCDDRARPDRLPVPEGATAEWIRAAPATPQDPYLTGTISEFLGPLLLLDDGTVVPRGAEYVDPGCGGRKRHELVGIPVEIHLDRRTGFSFQIVCR